MRTRTDESLEQAEHARSIAIGSVLVASIVVMLIGASAGCGSCGQDTSGSSAQQQGSTTSGAPNERRPHLSWDGGRFKRLHGARAHHEGGAPAIEGDDGGAAP